MGKNCRDAKLGDDDDDDGRSPFKSVEDLEGLPIIAGYRISVRHILPQSGVPPFAWQSRIETRWKPYNMTQNRINTANNQNLVVYSPCLKGLNFPGHICLFFFAGFRLFELKLQNIISHSEITQLDNWQHPPNCIPNPLRFCGFEYTINTPIQRHNSTNESNGPCAHMRACMNKLIHTHSNTNTQTHTHRSIRTFYFPLLQTLLYMGTLCAHHLSDRLNYVLLKLLCLIVPEPQWFFSFPRF